MGYGRLQGVVVWELIGVWMKGKKKRVPAVNGVSEGLRCVSEGEW